MLWLDRWDAQEHGRHELYHSIHAPQARQHLEPRQAWAFFQAQPPSYRRPAIWWVISAKQEDTRLKRLAILISDSEQGLRIKPLQRATKQALED